MSPLQLCALSVLRAFVVSLLTWLIVASTYSRMMSLSPPLKRWGLFTLLHFVAIPPLVPAYCYSTLTLGWIRSAWIAEGLYLTLLVAKSIPLFMMARAISPPAAISDAAWFVIQTNPCMSGIRWRAILLGLSSNAMPLIFVAWNAFQDFELASFLIRPTWTVWMFDAYVGGVPTWEVIRKGWSVSFVNCLVLLATIQMWIRMQRIPAVGDMPRMGSSRARWRVGCAIIVLIGLIATAIPGIRVVAESCGAYGSLITSSQLMREISVGIMIAVIAASLAYTGALSLLGLGSSYSPWIASVCCLPGVFGSLTLSLTVASVLQFSHASTYYGSYVPWIVALTLSMFPKALLLAMLVDAIVVRASTHAADIFGLTYPRTYSRQASQFAWALYGRRHAMALILIAYLAYLDLPTAAILGPPNAVPAPVRLYNLMHYGHSQLLAAMLVAAFAIPAMLACAVILLLNRVFRIGQTR